MRNYTTQMDAARKNIITPEMEKVAAKERMTPEEIRALVAEGKVAICANKNHKCLDPQGVGSMLKTKINVNLGVSKDCKDYDIEMKKVMEAVNMGAFESEDDYILAKMAMAEAEDQDTEGKALVIRVILNRVEDEHFPDTIKGVVSQKNAFTPYWNGRYKKVKPDADCYNALILVKNHDWDKSHGATYFEMTSGSTWHTTWHTRNLKRLFKHGCHTFYKEK